MTQKLGQIESQLVHANQMQIDKEEEVTLRFLEKESEITQEL